MTEFKIVEINQGYCRILYKAKNDLGQYAYYCLQDEGENYSGVLMYRCTATPWCEPNYEVKLKENNTVSFEIPKGNTKLEDNVRKWISNNVR